MEAKKDEIANLEAEIAAAAQDAKLKAKEIAAAAGVEVSAAQLEEAATTATAYGRERMAVLLKQVHSAPPHEPAWDAAAAAC